MGQYGSVGCLNIYSSFIPSRSKTVTSIGGKGSLFRLAHFSASLSSYKHSKCVKVVHYRIRLGLPFIFTELNFWEKKIRLF